MSAPASTTRFVVVGVSTAAVVVAACAAYWWFQGRGAKPSGTANDVASDEVVADFYTSLAALDVGENQLAAQWLTRALESEPREPALWANLAVARIRLREMERAAESIDKASALASDSNELALLRAQMLEQSGEIEQAIAQLRELHQVWPENVAVTYSLVDWLGRIRSDEVEAERLALLSDILAREPRNLRARCEQARVAASQQRGDQLRAALDALLRDGGYWPEAAREQLAEADAAARAGEFRQAAVSLTFFENLLKPHPQYQQSLAQLGILPGEPVATPLRSFVRLQMPAVAAADADVNLSFDVTDTSKTAARPDLVLIVATSGERSSTRVTLSQGSLRAGESAALPFPGSSTEATPASIGIADLNYDFQEDLVLVGPEGCRIFLGQDDGSFVAQQIELPEFAQAWRSVWLFDVEADGDLDLLLSDHESALRWIRNNGDMTFTAMSEFLPVEKVVSVRAVDLDGDGDVDVATLDTSGNVGVWQNERGGQFIAAQPPFDGPQLALAVGDIDRDGQFDLVSLASSGEIRSATWKSDGTWSDAPLTTWSPAKSLESAKAGDAFLAVADVDNNGGVDLVTSAAYETGTWLRTADALWTPLAAVPAMHVTSVADANGDGLLDLVGVSESAGLVATNRSQAGYGWQVIQPKANKTAEGDNRINSFGVGGRIEVRAGNLVQAAAIRGPRVHFGLGRHKQVDVAGIMWPNGTYQAEFDLHAREDVFAYQRLKGSCPWVFAFDGREFRFVKDFLWRSPLGLRINAQATAGVAQTEDWIEIPGSQMAAKDGHYQVRITAELWETHFFDRVALLAVDHPADAEVFVDERFVPKAAPTQKVIVSTPPQPFAGVADQRGNRLDEVLRTVDGTYADDFALGRYQGVAEEHWIEFELPAEVAADRRVLIVGNGWIYPTDSSLNVAIGQGSATRPFGLILEQQDASGIWHTVRDNLGFPAGKNKIVVIELPAGIVSQSQATSLSTSPSLSRKFRLRTNMEVYWDSLGWSYALDDVEPRVAELPLKMAELRHRGFSKLMPVDRRRPDTPLYEVASTQQQWLDLEGLYTRFGDVRELLTKVDDRYVIMNAGDELALEFAAGDAPPAGWRRDFVLVGDGWVKDGDFNTAFSKWVQPLPSHADREYAGPLVPLESDPVYQRHSDDWRNYHTRYVTPRRFRQGLWPPMEQPTSGESKQ